MFERVNCCHPDVLCDRIAGAIVDIAYLNEENPKVAVEVLAGHGECNIIIESSVDFNRPELQTNVKQKVYEITKTNSKSLKIRIKAVPQDVHLAENQSQETRCGDNGIFKGVPLTMEQKELARIARDLYSHFPTDGKYILHNSNLVICQSCATKEEIEKYYKGPNVIINPLGEWTGGINTDSGATNRKLGSNMADSVTGGGLHGKDLSKADVSVNIYCFEKAQELNQVVRAYCSIGADFVTVYFGEVAKKVPYKEIVDFAKEYINKVGGFEKFAEWGLF